jgi:uncharacterized protein YoaH (UPF0181 family)
MTLSKCPLLAHRKNTDKWSRMVKATTHYLTRDYDWLRDLVGTEAEAWVDAIEAIDLRGDKEPLLKLLTSQPGPSGILLADLLTRYQLKRRRGRQQVPLYKFTEQTVALQKAKERYGELLKTGVSRSEALKRVAKESRISKRTTQNYIDGKNAYTREAEKQVRALVRSASKS